jgi:hypothetical protein
MDQNVQSYPEAGWGETPSAPQKKGSKTILIVVIVLLVLCCCCVLFSGFMYQWGGDWLTDQMGITQWLVPGLFLA